MTAAAPALPLHAAGKYVAGAYVVFVALLLVYLSIMAIRLRRTERDLAELNRELSERDAKRAVEQEHREEAVT
jgi:uncharacterized membrane protein YecN with MAPEG domain